jgi:signal transduction histidine kinase
MDAVRLRSLHTALATLLLPLLLGLGVAGGALVWAQWESRRGAIHARLDDSAQYLGLLLERELAVETAVIETMSHSPLIDQRDWATLHALARRIAARRPGSLIALTDSSGQHVFNTAKPYGERLANVNEMERERRQADWNGRRLPMTTGSLTQRARQTGEPAYSNLYYGVVIGGPGLAVAVPVKRTDSAYTLTYSLSTRSVSEFIAAHNTFPGALAQLVDREGRVAASSASHDELVALPIPASLRSIEMPPVIELPGGDRPRLFARASTGPSGWKVVLSVPTSVAYRPAYMALATSIALMALAMALAAWLVYRHSLRIALPLRQLSARVLGEGAKAPLPSSDIREIALLAEAIHTAELAHERERDEQVRRRLAEEREMHARELSAELQHADRRKNDFLAKLAHELRNPLSPLLNAVHLLDRAADDSPADLEKLKAIMKRQLKHLGCLVEDLLDVTRIAQGKIELRTQRLDLRELLPRIADDYEALLREASIQLVVDLPPQPVHARIDPTRFTQMVSNLVQNAAKFTPPGGVISLSLTVSEGRARVVVRDTGAGLEASKLERLFEPFVQGDQNGARAGGGLGLGLTIVKGIAELHGGSVRAASEGPGRGAEFVIILPMTHAETAAPEALPQA